MEGTSIALLYEESIALTPTPYEEVNKENNCRAVSFMNIDVNMLNKILAHVTALPIFKG